MAYVVWPWGIRECASAWGVAQLEAERKTKWRKGYNGADKKKLSQYRTSVRYMCVEQELGHGTKQENPGSHLTFQGDMDDLFEATNCLLSSFVEALKKRGRARGESST